MSHPPADYRLSARRVLTPGRKLRVKGERGVFVYRTFSVASTGAVSLHMYGPEGFRAFRPERIARICK